MAPIPTVQATPASVRPVHYKEAGEFINSWSRLTRGEVPLPPTAMTEEYVHTWLAQIFREEIWDHSEAYRNAIQNYGGGQLADHMAQFRLYHATWPHDTNLFSQCVDRIRQEVFGLGTSTMADVQGHIRRLGRRTVPEVRQISTGFPHRPTLPDHELRRFWGPDRDLFEGQVYPPFTVPIQLYYRPLRARTRLESVLTSDPAAYLAWAQQYPGGIAECLAARVMNDQFGRDWPAERGTAEAKWLVDRGLQYGHE